MAAKVTKESTISIKVTVDKQNNKVMYAEADHTFVDVLFSFMTLPLASIAKLLNKQCDNNKSEVLTSLNNLYQSLVGLPNRFFLNEECKYMILNPRSSTFDHCKKLKVNIDNTEPKKYFVCQNSGCDRFRANFSNFFMASCHKCGEKMRYEMSFNDTEETRYCGVFVSDVTNFIVTDDLRVMPYTPGCYIELLVDHGVTDTSHLEEITFDLGYQQILYLLRLSFLCDSPLTHLVLNSSSDLFISKHGVLDHYTSDEKIDTKMFLQVTLQKSTGKFLFAEADGDFVDFVSGFLAISLGTVIGNFVNGNCFLACLENIYKSISDIGMEKYFKSKAMKDILLKPHFGCGYHTRNWIISIPFSNFPIVFLSPNTVKESTRLCGSFYTTRETWFLSYIRGQKMALNDPRVGEELIKRTGMFMLTDDLVITPTSSTSTMNTLSKCNVPLNDIERHKVCIGLKEGISMLKASMISSSSLSKGLEHQLKNLNRKTTKGLGRQVKKIKTEHLM